jgi:Ca2+-dependent lipid-binding protein
LSVTIFLSCSELELKPQGSLKVTVVKATGLKNMEMIGKSDPYVVLSIRPLFKVKTKVVNNNLNPVWDQTFELIAEDKETQSLTLEVLRHSLILPILRMCCYPLFSKKFPPKYANYLQKMGHAMSV